MTPVRGQFQDFLRFTWSTARDDLEAAIRQIIAEQSLTSLKSGATIKRIARAFEAVGVDAVTKSEEAATTQAEKTYLLTFLIEEVDGLAGITTDALDRLGLLETAARQLVAKNRDRVLAVRTAPAPARLTGWRRVSAWAAPHATSIGVAVVGGLILAALVLWLRLYPPT